jgi:hypothetical protein
MNTIHPFPGTASFLRGAFIGAASAAAPLMLLADGYALPAAAVVAFVVTLATAGE